MTEWLKLWDFLKDIAFWTPAKKVLHSIYGVNFRKYRKSHKSRET